MSARRIPLDNDRLQTHYRRAVDDLVQGHSRLRSYRLVLAVRYDAGDEIDVNILEVMDGWPGRPSDPLFRTQFDPNEGFLILGKLNLVLGSPKQLVNAIELACSKSRSAEAKNLRKLLRMIKEQGEVVFISKKPEARVRLARQLKRTLEL